MNRARFALAAVVVAAAFGAPAMGAASRGDIVVPAQWYAGAADVDINPTPEMIATKSFFLGGYGLGSGRVANRPELQAMEGRAATGILGQGVHSRAVVFSDGTRAVALVQVDTQGYFAAYKQGPFGIIDIRNQAAAAVTELRAANQLLPEMDSGAILIDSNHTHGGPDTAGVWGGVPTSYLKLVRDRTAAAIVAAYKALRPAKIAYGTAKGGVDGKDADPLISNQFRNDPANQLVDDELRVIQARDLRTNNVIVTYLNFSGHATVLGSGNTLVSADYTGPLSQKLASFGGVGFHQVGTLGRTQPARDGCKKPGLKDAAASICALEEYSSRVFARTKVALARATSIGAPKVSLHSYWLTDLSTSPALMALSYGGVVAGVPIYRAVNPPWFTGPAIGVPMYSGRIGDILVNGGPGEMYPQIPLTVRDIVKPRSQLNIGTAGDFLGYIIAPLEAYPEPIRKSLFDGEPFPTGSPQCDPVPFPSPFGCPSPVDNDNYFFNVSHTFGERLTCAMLRGAGEAFLGNKWAYWQNYSRCGLFANDFFVDPDIDARFPAQPDLSGLPGFDHLTPEFIAAQGDAFFTRTAAG